MAVFLIKNNLTEINKLQAFAQQVAQEVQLDEENQFRINLMMEEVVSNIILYGYPDGKSDEIQIETRIENNFIHLKISDKGLAFNPLKHTHKDRQGSEDISPGGLGIMLIRKLSQKQIYQRIDNTNILTLIFDIHA